jgi:hypothetical protein
MKFVTGLIPKSKYEELGLTYNVHVIYFRLNSLVLSLIVFTMMFVTLSAGVSYKNQYQRVYALVAMAM